MVRVRNLTALLVLCDLCTMTSWSCMVVFEMGRFGVMLRMCVRKLTAHVIVVGNVRRMRMVMSVRMGILASHIVVGTMNSGCFAFHGFIRKLAALFVVVDNSFWCSFMI